MTPSLIYYLRCDLFAVVVELDQGANVALDFAAEVVVLVLLSPYMFKECVDCVYEGARFALCRGTFPFVVLACRIERDVGQEFDFVIRGLHM